METLQRTANRGSISTGYDIDNSIKLEHANNEWLYRASPTEGNRRTFTFSFWIKRSRLGNPTASGTMYVAGQGQHGRMYFTSDYFGFRFDDGHDTRDITTYHRDPSAWLHVVVAVDTNQSSSSNRVKIYFNGVQTTTIDFDGGSYPDLQDQASGWFTTNYLTVGTAPFGGSYNAGDGDYDMSGYLAEFCAVDGQQLDPTDFGETNADGVWVPIDVSGINFGSQGYYLKFDDTSSSGKDSSGNGNNFSDSNLSAADHSTDTPTNNFCIANNAFAGAYTISLSEGGTYVPMNGVNANNQTQGTLGVTKGKWYYECYINMRSATYGLTIAVGWCNFQGNYHDSASSSYLFGSEGGKSNALYYLHGGYFYTFDNGSATNSSSIAGLGTSEVGKWLGVALDLDANTISYTIDGSAVTNGSNLDIQDVGDQAAAGIPMMPAISVYDNNFTLNFGGYTAQAISSGNSDANGYGNFEHAVPSGYYALCTKNLAEFG